MAARRRKWLYSRSAMQDDDLETYRAMTPGERLALALELSEACWRWLDVPDRAAGDRKWAAWNREHDRGNEALLEALRRHRLAGGGA
jgi:hypothetical protein